MCSRHLQRHYNSDLKVDHPESLLGLYLDKEVVDQPHEEVGREIQRLKSVKISEDRRFQVHKEIL